MKENFLDSETKIGKKSYLFFPKILILILFLLIFVESYLLYKQNKDLIIIRAKINNISSELSIANEKFQEVTEKIEKNNVVTGNFDNENGDKFDNKNITQTKNAELNDRLSLINCFIELKNIIDNNGEMTNACHMILYAKDEIIKDKFNKIDLTKISDISYIKLKKSFKNLAQLIQEDITKKKLIEVKIPAKLALYLTKFFSWRKIYDKNSKNFTESEMSLVNCEKYIKEKKINLMLDELKLFDDIESVKKWKEDAAIYCENLNIIDETLNYLLKKGE